MKVNAAMSNRLLKKTLDHVILSEAKNLNLGNTLEILRFAQNDNSGFFSSVLVRQPSPTAPPHSFFPVSR